jgi:hypothetical protein
VGNMWAPRMRFECPPLSAKRQGVSRNARMKSGFLSAHTEKPVGINDLENQPKLTVNRMVAGSNPARGAN